MLGPFFHYFLVQLQNGLSESFKYWLVPSPGSCCAMWTHHQWHAMWHYGVKAHLVCNCKCQTWNVETFLRRMWLYEKQRISAISQLSYLWWDKLFMVSTEMTLLSSFVIWTLTSSHSSTGITSPSLYLIQNAGMSTESTYRNQLNSHQMRLEALASVTVQVMSTEDPLLAKMSGAPSIFVTGTKIEVNMCSFNE